MGIDREIFDAAGQPEQTIPDEHIDSAVSDAIRGLRDRDPEPAPPPPSGAPAQPTGPDPLAGIEDRSNSGLLRALLDERDKRQSAEQRSARYDAQEKERAKQEGRAPLNERLFTHPQETLDELRNEWTQPLVQQLQELRVNQNFGMAHMRHGESFEKAWTAWYETVRDGKDAQTYFHVMNSADPGEALVQWHGRNQVFTETGGDLNAYKQKVIDEYLAGQGRPRASNGQFTAKPQAPQPPTSIARMGTSGAPEDDDANDGSDAAIFAAARPPPRNRRR